MVSLSVQIVDVSEIIVIGFKLGIGVNSQEASINFT